MTPALSILAVGALAILIGILTAKFLDRRSAARVLAAGVPVPPPPRPVFTPGRRSSKC